MNISDSKGNIFVGGPIQYALKAKVFEPGLQSQINSIIDILKNEGYHIFSAHHVEKFGSETHLFTERSIASRDFIWMKGCELFIALLPNNEDGTIMRTDGTHIELGWASSMNKPIIIITPDTHSKQLSQLLIGLEEITDVYFLDLEEVIENPLCLTKTVCHIFTRTHDVAELITAGSK